MTSPTAPRTSVLIPAYNEAKLLSSTLAAVRESFAAVGDASYEIVVCDNNSTDRTSEVAKRHGARVVFEPHNQIARARNAALAEARGEWLIFLDADTTMNPGLLAETFQMLESGKVCGGGSVIHFAETRPSLLGSSLTRMWNTISATLQLAAGSYVYCLRRAAVEVGGFEEKLYAAEELAFSRALKRWGRQHRMRFRVLRKHPIHTSGRKMEWYGQWRMLQHLFLLFSRPFAIRRREHCGLWYQRPPESEVHE